MDFISSSILGGLLWDGIKKGLPLTIEYFQQNIQGYSFSHSILTKLEKLTQQFPQNVTTSEQILIAYIEKNKEWQAIRSQISPTANFTQNISGENAKGIQANNINTLNM